MVMDKLPGDKEVKETVGSLRVRGIENIYSGVPSGSESILVNNSVEREAAGFRLMQGHISTSSYLDSHITLMEADGRVILSGHEMLGTVRLRGTEDQNLSVLMGNGFFFNTTGKPGVAASGFGGTPFVVPQWMGADLRQQPSHAHGLIKRVRRWMMSGKAKAMRWVLDTANNRMNMFAKLALPDIDQKLKLAHVLMSHEVRLAAISRRGKVWGDAILWIGMSVAALHIFVVSPYAAYLVTHVHYSTLVWVVVWYLSLVVFLLVYSFVVGPILLWGGGPSGTNARTILIIGWVVGSLGSCVVAIRYIALVPRYHNLVGFAGFAGALGTLGSLVLIGGVAVLASAIEAHFKREAFLLHPDAIAADRLLAITTTLNDPHRRWTSLGSKTKLLRELEEVAQCLETYMPAHLRTGDVVSDQWLKERAAQMAAPMRQYKQWVLTPMNDTHLELARRLSEALVSVLGGAWDRLERSEPVRLSQTQRRSWGLEVLKGAFIAALPFAALGALRRLGIPIMGEVANYLTAGAALWSVLVMLDAIDPTYVQRLAALKELRQLLQSGGRRGSE